jgi:hypothetical protein
MAGYGLDGKGSSPNIGKACFLLQSIQIGSGVHPASCPYPLLEGKAPSNLHLVLRSRMVELYHHSPWRSADLISIETALHFLCILQCLTFEVSDGIAEYSNQNECNIPYMPSALTNFLVLG